MEAENLTELPLRWWSFLISHLIGLPRTIFQENTELIIADGRRRLRLELVAKLVIVHGKGAHPELAT